MSLAYPKRGIAALIFECGRREKAASTRSPVMGKPASLGIHFQLFGMIRTGSFQDGICQLLRRPKIVVELMEEPSFGVDDNGSEIVRNVAVLPHNDQSERRRELGEGRRKRYGEEPVGRIIMAIEISITDKCARLVKVGIERDRKKFPIGRRLCVSQK